MTKNPVFTKKLASVVPDEHRIEFEFQPWRPIFEKMFSSSRFGGDYYYKISVVGHC
jgi:hypothetical protein